MNIAIENVVATLEKISNIHEFDNEHGTRTASIAVAIGKRLNGGDRLNAEKLQLLEHAARVHDLGRVGVDNHVIAKNGRLTKSQTASMREHCQIGYDLVKDVLPYEISGTILYHHEHWDGTGYPEGLKGLDIPLFARIICIADSYDGIISERPYHRQRVMETALDEMNKHINWFDPRLFGIFLGVLRDNKDAFK